MSTSESDDPTSYVSNIVTGKEKHCRKEPKTNMNNLGENERSNGSYALPQSLVSSSPIESNMMANLYVLSNAATDRTYVNPGVKTDRTESYDREKYFAQSNDRVEPTNEEIIRKSERAYESFLSSNWNGKEQGRKKTTIEESLENSKNLLKAVNEFNKVLDESSIDENERDGRLEQRSQKGFTERQSNEFNMKSKERNFREMEAIEVEDDVVIIENEQKIGTIDKVGCKRRQEEISRNAKVLRLTENSTECDEREKVVLKQGKNDASGTCAGKLGSWTVDEVLHMCISWSVASKYGEQSELQFWGRATDYAVKHFNFRRSKYSMRDKWKTVQPELQKWIGYYRRMCVRYVTGNRSEETYVKYTNRAYYNDRKKHFKYIAAAKYMMENTDKFGSYDGKGGLKRSNEVGSSEVTSRGGLVSKNGEHHGAPNISKNITFELANDTDVEPTVGKVSNAHASSHSLFEPNSRSTNNDEQIDVDVVHGKEIKKPTEEEGKKGEGASMLRRPVTKEASSIENVSVHDEESDKHDVVLVESKERPAGAKAIKEANLRRSLDHRKSELTKMRESVERANAILE